MVEKLIAYFSKITPLTEEEKEAILEDVRVERFPKGSRLLSEGEALQTHYFVLEGIVRQYYLVDGVERTAGFFTEGEWLLMPTAVAAGEPSPYFLSCVEECALVVGDEERGNRLLERFPRFQDLSRRILEMQLRRQQSEMASFVTDSPAQRYQKLLEQKPDLVQRVPQYQLASYIGVTPESLSRIRRRISQIKS